MSRPSQDVNQAASDFSSLSDSSRSLPSPSSSSPRTKVCSSCKLSLEKPLLCSRCRAPYCSSSCQRKDWKIHKRTCRAQAPSDSFEKDKLALPLEVLERIVAYVFLRPTSFTPASNPYHLNHTTHLLLVSHSFRLLCLPLLFRSITISRPSHYARFFHYRSGLFSFGPNASTYWSYVQELSIVQGIDPPLTDNFNGGYLDRLSIPTGRVQQVCFLDPTSRNPLASPIVWNAKWAEQEEGLEALVRTDSRMWNSVVGEMEDEYDEPLEEGGGLVDHGEDIRMWCLRRFRRDEDQELVGRLKKYIAVRVRKEREDWFGGDVLDGGCQRGYVWKLSEEGLGWLRARVGSSTMGLGEDSLAVYRLEGRKRLTLKELMKVLGGMHDRLTLKEIRLVGYAREVVEEMEALVPKWTTKGHDHKGEDAPWRGSSRREGEDLLLLPDFTGRRWDPILQKRF